LTTNKTILRFGLGRFPPILKLVPILVSTEPQVPPTKASVRFVVELGFKVVDQRLTRDHWARIHHQPMIATIIPRTEQPGADPFQGTTQRRERENRTQSLRAIIANIT
jgi:hypothetical protein